MLNNEHTSYTVGIYADPNEHVSFGADYGRQTYDSFQESRNASPAPNPQFTDPTRNWNLAIDEKVNTFSLYLNLVKALAKTDIRIAYDLSDSDQGFLHGGPRIPNLTFVALPNVTNKWQRATVDLRYSVSEKLGLGLSYWYEKFEVEDYATINTAGPATLPRPELGAQTDDAQFDWLGGLMTGYGNRPYKKQTVFASLSYMF